MSHVETDTQKPTSAASKPIAFYLSDLEDSATLAQIAIIYGDRLESLDRIQKLSFLNEISAALLERFELEDNRVCAAPNKLLDQVETLSNSALLGLVSAISDQLRNDQ